MDFCRELYCETFGAPESQGPKFGTVVFGLGEIYQLGQRNWT